MKNNKPNIMSNTKIENTQKKTLFVLTDGIDFYHQFIEKVNKLKSIHESEDQLVNGPLLPFYNKDIRNFVKSVDFEFFADEPVFLDAYNDLKHLFETDHSKESNGIQIRRIIFIPQIDQFPFSTNMEPFFNRSYIKDLSIHSGDNNFKINDIIMLAMHLEYKII